MAQVAIHINHKHAVVLGCTDASCSTIKDQMLVWHSGIARHRKSAWHIDMPEAILVPNACMLYSHRSEEGVHGIAVQQLLLRVGVKIWSRLAIQYLILVSLQQLSCSEIRKRLSSIALSVHVRYHTMHLAT